MSAAESLHRRTRRDLDQLGVRPRRRLGQNFLVASSIVQRIVEVAQPAGHAVVEIGPGMGALSDALAAVCDDLVLVEIDPRMAQRLAERYVASPNVRVVTADALEVDFERLVEGRAAALAIGNLPYSVGTAILARLLDPPARFARLVLMLQLEVARRLVAAPGSKAYGALSVLTALRGEARIAFRVPAGAFVPRPKVESAVVVIDVAPAPRVAVIDERWFREVVRRAFGQRRKTLRGALAGIATPADIARAEIDPGRRGETLSLAEFARLANLLRAGTK
jgi:16S rRNA (adenine1518-N6/adenine1519-N6)-dimethyltransferase